MTFDDFLARRDALRTTRPELLDLSELNVYRALGPEFPPLTPSTHPEAPYRCHLAERALAHLGFPAAWKARTLVSHGVRRSLEALFGAFASAGLRVALPSDVYPVYFELAACAGLSPAARFAARDGLPAELPGLDVVLLCEPKKPWTQAVTEEHVHVLEAWLSADPKRLVVLDSAYATPPSSTARRLLDTGRAVLCWSLSKGWLIPDHGGVCVVPEPWVETLRPRFAALPKDETKLRIAYGALTESAPRVAVVQQRLSALASRLDAVTSARPALQASRCVGYFAESPLTFPQLLEQGVLAVPASVFGSTEARCVLSSLPPVVGRRGN